jgi:hypothetical protein
VTLVLLPAAGCGSSGPKVDASAQTRLVLQRADLPKPFTPFYVGPQLMADQTPARADPKRFGRKGGWIARYRRAGSRRTPGPLIVVSRVDVFGDASGAKKDLDRYRSDFAAPFAKRVHAPRLGAEAIAIVSGQGSGATAVRTYAIAWREGNATAELEANGFARRFSLSDASKLARKQDARLRSRG